VSLVVVFVGTFHQILDSLKALKGCADDESIGKACSSSAAERPGKRSPSNFLLDKPEARKDQVHTIIFLVVQWCYISCANLAFK